MVATRCAEGLLGVRVAVHDGAVPSTPSAFPRRRRPRGQGGVGLHVAVPASIRDEINTVATTLSITSGRYIEILVARDRAVVDHAGRPAWVRDEVDLIKTVPMPGQEDAPG